MGISSYPLAVPALARQCSLVWLPMYDLGVLSSGIGISSHPLAIPALAIQCSLVWLARYDLGVLSSGIGISSHLFDASTVSKMLPNMGSFSDARVGIGDYTSNT